MSALVHGVYAYTYVTELDMHMLAAEQEPALREALAARLGINVQRLEEGVKEIIDNLWVDAAGESFFSDMFSWIESTMTRARDYIGSPDSAASHSQRIHAGRARRGLPEGNARTCEASLRGITHWTLPRIIVDDLGKCEERC
jgi:hypothetical protein